MANPDDYLYEYAIIRYVPSIERGEFMNVGLLMMCKRRRWIHCEILLDRERLMALDPETDTDALQNQLEMFRRDGVPFPGIPVEERYRWLTAAKSAIIQTSPSHPGVVMPQGEFADPSEPLRNEFDRLMKELVCSK